MNAIPKYVISTTLTGPEWANTTVISSEVVERIQQLKDEPGQDIIQYGFGPVSTLLMEHGLLDELRLWIHPLFVGKRNTDDLLFPKGPPTQFELTDTTILKNSMAILTYRLA
jgi:dihydrofolate reductase